MLSVECTSGNVISIKENCLIVGSNGSGKTYFLQSISKLNAANCSVWWNGTKVSKPYPIIGYHSQDSYLPNNMTVQEVFKVRGASCDDVEMFGISPNTKVDRLSGGQQQIISVLQAFKGMNSVVVLDEPLNNIDTHNRRLLVDWMGKQEKRIIASGHFNDEMMKLFPEVIVFKDKAMIYHGSLKSAYFSPDVDISGAFGEVYKTEEFLFRPEWTRFSQDARYTPNCEIRHIEWRGGYSRVEFDINKNTYQGNHYTDKQLECGPAFVNFKMRVNNE